MLRYLLECLDSLFESLVPVMQIPPHPEKDLVGSLDPLPLVGIEGRPDTMPVSLYHRATSFPILTSGLLVVDYT